MQFIGRFLAMMLAASAVWGVTIARAGGSGDHNHDGYVDLDDYPAFEFCLTASGPAGCSSSECAEFFDADADGDVDLQDFTAFVRARGHLPMPLKDYLGNPITADSTKPYSRRHTCGGCHDADRVCNGIMFQQGRTDVAGAIDMRDEYYGDGRFWIKSSGRFGKWGQSFVKLLAAKENASESEIDQTAYAWVRDCSGCHPGGGPGEFDRDGERYFDENTGTLGYENLGSTPQDVALDGDYSLLDYATGGVSLAPWDATGVSEPDCLMCHRAGRTLENGWDMNWVWRAATLSAGASLVDAGDRPVPAFLAAGTAGQGWFANLEFSGFPGLWPSASRLQIDYAAGLSEGSLTLLADDTVALAPEAVTWPPRDRACWGCHSVFGVTTGSVWFDDTNVMYRRFNNLHDADPVNDIPPEQSTACTVCHVGDLDHNFGKGNSLQMGFRDELDWERLRTCRDCHWAGSTERHPDAPVVPSPTSSDEIHRAPGFDHVSCQGCHIPYALQPALLFRDITIPGATGTTSQYLSADPLDPASPDKSRWHPPFMSKLDEDGVERLFPCNIWITIYWADWDRNGTPEDYSDDIIAPIPSWRIDQLTGGAPLVVVTDDNGDGQLEINRFAEILAYITLLKGDDSYGRPVAANPVLVKGMMVWYEDPDVPGTVRAMTPAGTGIPIEWYPYLWGMDHNVRPKEEAIGYPTGGDPQAGCRDCHRAMQFDSPVFDRRVLIDPFGPTGLPLYLTVRAMTGLNPP